MVKLDSVIAQLYVIALMSERLINNLSIVRINLGSD
jgi:hypothetical protein